MNRDLTGDEFEDITADVRRIVDVATGLGIGLNGGECFDIGPVVFEPELICLNGVGDEAAEPLQIWRKIPFHPDYYMPTLNFCKTYQRNYTPVVQAALMTVKQRVPNDTWVSSNGDWGYEWLHGAGCYFQDAGPQDGECRNDDPRHVGLGGRELYRLAFPDSPEPMNPFGSPLAGTELEGQPLYISRGMPLTRRGSGFEGAVFGVTLDFLLEQSKRRTKHVCMLCGEICASRIKTVRPRNAPRQLNAPMCDSCYRERVKTGKLLGFRCAQQPYRLVLGTA